MRRRVDKPIPIELEILRAARSLKDRGVHEFHGYVIAKEMRSRKAAKLLTSYGTLYKALARLEAAQLLGSHWEDPHDAIQENRPRRRLYYLKGGVQQPLFRGLEGVYPSHVDPYELPDEVKEPWHQS